MGMKGKIGVDGINGVRESAFSKLLVGLHQTDKQRSTIRSFGTRIQVVADAAQKDMMSSSADLPATCDLDDGHLASGLCLIWPHVEYYGNGKFHTQLAHCRQRIYRFVD